MAFVVNFLCFPAVQNFENPLRFDKSYREFKGGNLFETQCICNGNLHSLSSQSIELYLPKHLKYTSIHDTTIFTCAQKQTSSQLSLPHGTIN